jgi:hypothetical protein
MRLGLPLSPTDATVFADTDYNLRKGEDESSSRPSLGSELLPCSPPADP